jgi:hypothetical protein
MAPRGGRGATGGRHVGRQRPGLGRHERAMRDVALLRGWSELGSRGVEVWAATTVL